MAEVFTGDLSQIGLLDILNLLIREGKTGKVALKKGGTLGEIFVENGRIIHGAAETAYGEEAVYFMMTWMIGKFSYTPDVSPETRTIHTSPDQMLSEGMQRVQEWNRIRKAIPSTETAFRLSSRTKAEDIVLKAEEWNMLVRLDGVKTLGEISREFGLSDIEMARKLYRLLMAELIEVAEKPAPSPKRVLGKAFFDIVERELMVVMGPIAPVLIQDHVADMDEKMSAFPRELTAELVEGISMEISDEGRRVDFQRKMLEILKRI